MTTLYIANQNGIQSTDDRFMVLNKQKKTSGIEGFETFENTAHEIQEKSEDFKVYGMDIHPFLSDEGIKVKVDGAGTFNLTEWSLNQLSTKIGVPAAYAMKMAEAKKYDLFVENFRSWIDSHAGGKKFLVRAYDDTIRGVLGDTYFPTDTDFSLPLFREGLQKTGMNFMVHKGIINPEYTNIRVVSDRTINVGDDPHFVGVSISTSDVGRASLKMEFFVYRSRCENGMLFGKKGGILFKKKHTSKFLTTQGVFRDEVVASLNMLPQLIEKTEEMLVQANKVTLKDEDIQKIIDQYAKYSGAGKKEMESIDEMIKNHMPIYNNEKATLWSVSNAFTEAAQLFKVDKAESMETFAGHLLATRLAA